MQETTKLALRRVLLVRKQATGVVTKQMGLYQQPEYFYQPLSVSPHSSISFFAST